MAEVSDAQLAQLGIKLERISIRVNSFGSSLATISNQMAQASALEQMKEKQEQDRQRILAEQALAAGKESVFERKLQSALVKPLQSIGQKTAGALEVLKRFFLALGTAWLTGRGFEALQAAKEGNKKKLEEIRDEILKTLRQAFIIFRLIKVGIGTAIRTITGFTGRIFNAIYTGLIKRPFRAVMNGIRGALRIATNTIRRLVGAAALPARIPNPRNPNANNRGGGGRGGMFGRLFNAMSTFMNLNNAEYTDAGIAGAALLLPRGGKIGLVKALLGAAFSVDEILEAFGSNLFGRDPQAQKELMDAARAQSGIPQGIMRGFTGTLDAITGNMFDFDGMGKGAEVNTSQANFQEIGKSNTAGGSPTAVLSVPAQISSPGNAGTPPSAVGPIAAPQPEVNIIPASVPPQQVPSEQAAQASSIPHITPFNVDNFYPLYSQINYNVVT